jgi:hypothetical protein
MGSAPKIPPQPKIEFPAIPPYPEIEFPAIEMPSYDPEAVERKKQKARDEELSSVIGRKERGRAGTVKTGPRGLPNDEESQPNINRPGLLAKY